MKLLRLLALVATLCVVGAVPAVAAAAPPAGVTGMSLDGAVELAWQPAAGATAYRVYRGTSATTVTTPLMASPMVPPDLTVPASFTDIGAINGTTYYYAVRAIIGGVESANSRIVQARPRARSCSGANDVVRENCFPGDADWDVLPLTGVAGYATEKSIQQGQSVDLKVNSAGANVDIEIFRSGDYGGMGARLYSTMLDVPVAAQPACTTNASLGLYDCANWSVTETLTTTTSWPSGVYLVRLRRRDTGRESHILLVVRDDDREADLLYGVPTSTYQAYNAYGGKSLYDNKSSGAQTVAGTARAVKVSYDRPYQQPHDDGQYDWYTRSDFATVRWLERSGYDMSYAAVDDFERTPARLQGHKAFISGTHDEYYSNAMRAALEQARDSGTDIFFTGANEVYWRVRFEASPANGRQDRVLVSYKSTQGGAPDPVLATGTWRDAAGANRPENALAGGMYIGEQTQDFFPLRVSAQEGHDRIWRYTGLDTQATGASTNVGTSLVGWEWDARVDNGAAPAGLTTLSTSPVAGRLLQDAGGVYTIGSATSNATKYTAPSGALVVSTGTNHWNWGLALTADDSGEPDRRIQQATTNVLLDMGAAPETPASNMVLDDPAAPPLVTSRVPVHNSTGVQPSATVRATFSRPMNPASLSAGFSLRRPDGTTVPSVVTYDSVSFTATITPNLALSLATTYTARLDAAVQAANGIALGSPITWSFTTRPPDTTPPSVAITAPAAGDTVVASAQIQAAAADDAAVAGVQFKLDGQNLGAEDTGAPYAFAWDARQVSTGTHELTAVARDSSGNQSTSAAVSVTVDPSGLVAAYGFEETSGSTVVDRSGRANPGTISGAVRSASGRFGSALTFDGVNDWVTTADSASLDLSTAMTLEAWVNPTTVSGWRTIVMKEQSNSLAYALYGNTSTNRPSAHAYTTSEHEIRGTAALPANTWSHVASTYDGATLRLFVNGVQVGSTAFTGSLVASTGVLRVGGTAVWNEFFAGRIDEVRVYRRALGVAEIQQDMTTPVVPTDTQPPTAPASLTATGGVGSAQLAWSAATDNLGVVQYNVHRSQTAGFTPSAANRIAQVTGTTFTDTGLTAGTYRYRVTAEDNAGNVGPASPEATATATADTTAPSVAISAPADGATIVGTVNVTATATDNVAVAGVQFRLDSGDLGAEDTAAAYSTAWDSRTATNGPHTLRAIARDGAGITTTSAPINVTVNNPPVDSSGLVGAWGFEEASGAAIADSSTQVNGGTIAGATRTASGRFGAALTFDGADDIATVPDSPSLDLSTAMTLEAWVNPTATTGWRTILMKEQAAGLTYGMYGNGGSNRPAVHAFTSAEEDLRGTAALAANTWSHLAATYDGATMRLYLNGTQVATRALSGALVTSTGALRLGGNSIWGEYFGGRIDEVRIYNRALTAAEIGQDMNRPVVGAVSDAQPPTAPATLTATGGLGGAQLSWAAATDNTGVVRYNVHRGQAAGFTPSAANRVAQVTGTTYADTGLAAGDWYYRVTAEDAAGNVGPASPESRATVVADTAPPTVSVTAPTGGTVTGTVTITASAADDVAVTGVRFTVDGENVGNEDASAPYSQLWDTLSLANGNHTLRAVARDAAGHTTTSSPVTVNVDNPPVDNSGLVGAWGFEDGTGATVTDYSSAGNDGAITGAAWSEAGRFGNALSFDGVDDRIDVPDADSLDLSDAVTIEAWVKPAQHLGWRTVLMKQVTGGLSYAMYSSAGSDNPSGHINTGSETFARATDNLPVARWSHLATTWDGTTLRLFVDGAQVASQAVGGTLGISNLPLQIGGNTIWGEYFKGLIDEVRVYRRALTTAEIATDMAASVDPNAAPTAGLETTGEFANVQTWPLVPVHMATTSDGKVVVWDGFDAAVNSERIWDPNTGTFTPIPTGRNLFCAGHVTLPDGRLFIAGGHVSSNVGTKDTSIFNPATGTWFFGQDMARARWYPTVTTLPDGRILVLSGDNITLNAPGLPTPLKNGSETLPEIYDVATNTWTPLLAGQRRMALYPFMFVLPNGKVFDAGPEPTTRTLDTTTGQWTTVGQSPIDGHSAVMYRPGKIIKSGTWGDPDFPGTVATNRAAAIDMTDASPAWREAAPMHHGRSFHTLTSLADGTVLASGGMSETDGIDHSKAVFPTEIWDPVTDTWTETAAHQRAREYHSSALLLQDGRVLLAGGGAFGPAQNESNAEIYAPPYLFKGPRPTITSSATTASLGQSLNIETPDAARIDKVSFIRMGSVTHNFDMDQRFMHLTNVQRSGTTVTADLPTSANVAPPGWYYVFLIDDKGVPSKGWITKLEPSAGDTQAPGAPGTPTAQATGADVQLDWAAATDDTGVTEYRVHRATTAGFTPTAGNRIATVPTGTTYTDRNLAPGTYHYRVIAADAALNLGPASPEGSATVAADTAGPTVSVTAPAPAQVVGGGTVPVTANAADDRGVTSVQFRVDGTDLGAPDTSAPYSATWDTRPLANGTHRLTAVARDAAGNATTSAPVDVTVDNGAPPTVALTAPAASATVSGAVDVTANAADDRGVTSVQFRVDGADLGAPDTAPPYAVVWSSTASSNGPHNLTAVARDADGNATTSAPVAVTVANTAPGDLIAAYGFDEASGTSALDASGSGLTGTIAGATRSAAGRFGGALSFDAVNDWVTVPDSAPLDLTTGMTLEAWVRPTTVSAWRTVLLKEAPGELVYALYAATSSGRPSVHVNTGSEIDTRGTGAVAVNTWTHLAGTYDGTTLRMYVNGIQVSSRAATGAMINSTGALRIGGNNVWPEFFGGLIDEVRVYRRALTPAEIQGDMVRAVTG